MKALGFFNRVTSLFLSGTGLGSGAPANGIQYQNNSAGDFGVNRDGLGNLRGHAWGALRREWIKLLFQRRSYLIWGGAVAIPFLIALAFYLAKTDPHGGEGPLFFQASQCGARPRCEHISRNAAVAVGARPRPR